jgi:hypothetical protein
MKPRQGLILIAEAKVAQQEDVVAKLMAQRRDASEAKSMLAGLRYNLRVLRQLPRRHGEVKSLRTP